MFTTMRRLLRTNEVRSFYEVEIVSMQNIRSADKSGCWERWCRLWVLCYTKYQVKFQDGRVQRRHVHQLHLCLADTVDPALSFDTELDTGPQLTMGGATDQGTVTEDSDPQANSTIVPEP